MNPSRITTVRAFILKRKNVGESDKVLTLFTKTNGKQRVIAKGIRKITSRRGPHLDIFNEVKITIHKGKTWDTVSEVDTISSRRNVYTTWMRMRAAYIIVEVIDKLLPDYEPQPTLYDRIGKVLDTLETAKDIEVPTLLLSFLNDALIILGYLHEEKRYNDFSEMISYIEQISERKIRSLKFFL
ncbi:MAG: DNA repair protein RecO [Candidatus Gottesmanbacteria bacterium]